MVNIVVAFPRIENAKSIKRILVQSGFSVSAVCTSGAHVLQSVNELGDGIVICANQLTDMVYQELYQDLPPNMEMLLVASQNVRDQRETADIMYLSMPLKVHELLCTVEMMEYNIARNRKKKKAMLRQRSEEENEIMFLAASRYYEVIGDKKKHKQLKKVIKEYDDGAQFKRTIFVYGKNLLDLAKQLYERACHV